MADIDISSLSVASAQDALRRGDFTSVELTQAVLDAIAAKDGAIGAYLTVDADGALAPSAPTSRSTPTARSPAPPRRTPAAARARTATCWASPSR